MNFPYIHKYTRKDQYISTIWRHKGMQSDEVGRSSRMLDRARSWAAVNYLLHQYPDWSAHMRLTPNQWRVLFCGLVTVMLCALFLPQTSLLMVSFLYIGYCLLVLVTRVVLAWHGIKVSVAEEMPVQTTPETWPIITILVPLYDEENMVPGLFANLERLDYPKDKLDIKIVLEADDTGTVIAARRIFKGKHYRVVETPVSQPRTKPKACNYALWGARGDYTVIYDAEDRPEPDQLKKAVIGFAQASPKTACLQARLSYYNGHQNLLTRLFTLEYGVLFDVFLPGLSHMRLPLPLGGTSNFFKTDVLLELGGWDPFNVTEDADLGLRIAAAGYECAVFSSTTFEQATSSLKPWLHQRSRWIKGYLQTWLVHMRRNGKRTFCRGRQSITLHLVVGGVVLSALLNPIFWLYAVIWMIDGKNTSLGFVPSAIHFSGMTAFFFGNAVPLILCFIAPLKRRQWRHAMFFVFMPVYWILQSVAGYIAIWQFIKCPHHWNKTPHTAES